MTPPEYLEHPPLISSFHDTFINEQPKAGISAAEEKAKMGEGSAPLQRSLAAAEGLENAPTHHLHEVKVLHAATTYTVR